MKEFTEGQELEFDVYGYKVKGTYISMIDKRVLKIKVTYDESEVTPIGCTANVNQSFIVKH